MRHFIVKIDSIVMFALTFGAAVFHTEHVTDCLRLIPSVAINTFDLNDDKIFLQWRWSTLVSNLNVLVFVVDYDAVVVVVLRKSRISIDLKINKSVISGTHSATSPSVPTIETWSQTNRRSFDRNRRSLPTTRLDEFLAKKRSESPSSRRFSPISPNIRKSSIKSSPFSMR